MGNVVLFLPNGAGKTEISRLWERNRRHPSLHQAVKRELEAAVDASDPGPIDPDVLAEVLADFDG